jgi:hypothetical protein
MEYAYVLFREETRRVLRVAFSTEQEIVTKQWVALTAKLSTKLALALQKSSEPGWPKCCSKKLLSVVKLGSFVFNESIEIVLGDGSGKQY